jgi:hypothetical protein
MRDASAGPIFFVDCEPLRRETRNAWIPSAVAMLASHLALARFRCRKTIGFILAHDKLNGLPPAIAASRPPE